MSAEGAVFGYVKVTQSELRVKEYEFYRGVYCGLCRSMGKCTGQCSRMALSYDFAFLAIARLALTGQEFSFEKKRCAVHILHKRSIMKRNGQLDFCAYAAALLNYHKLLDDKNDEKGAKKLRAALLMPLMKRGRKKALKNGYAELDLKISELLARLSEFEAKREASVDLPAAIFGEILGEICSFGLEGTEARIAAALGKHIGSWVYIADALDDMADDKKLGRYNPILLLYGGELPSRKQIESIEIALKNELYEAESAVDLIEFDNIILKNIIQNIIYLGMPAKIKEIAAKYSECECSEASRKRKTGKEDIK